MKTLPPRARFFQTLDILMPWDVLAETASVFLQREGESEPDDVRTSLGDLLRMLIVQSSFGLSDEDLFWFIEDSRLLSDFVGTPQPDPRLYVTFRQKLNEYGGVGPVFEMIEKRLGEEGLFMTRGICNEPGFSDEMSTWIVQQGETLDSNKEVARKSQKTELFDVVLQFCRQGRRMKVETFAVECGMNRRRLYRIMKGETQPKPLDIKRIAEKLERSEQEVECLIDNPYAHFKIKHLSNPAKQNASLAGKICWNPKLNEWEYQIVLYNDLIEPPSYSHPVWEALRSHRLPVRAGHVAWETGTYLFYVVDV